MPFIKLKLPPGVFSNGTLYEAAGRWYRSNLVRWSEGVMAPIGGWLRLLDSNTDPIDVTDPIRGLFAWRDENSALRFLYGTKDAVYHLAAGVETDITPTSGFTGGDADAVSTSGQYDVGNYGAFDYGVGNESQSTLAEANTWQFDNYGEIPVALAYSDGKILDWDLNIANNFAPVTNAPTDCAGVVVTPERILVALGAGGDPRYVAWSDQADRTDWTPSSSDTAGGYYLPGQGGLMCGKRLPTETLLLTDVDAFAMRWIGGALIYRFDQVGSNCGVISRLGLTTAEGRAFWMGKRGFFMYEGGFARPIPCPVSDEVFESLNESQRSKVAAWPNSRYHEVWFAYPTSGENDRIVCYNYLENHWSGPWTLSRTSGMDAGASDLPLAACPTGGIWRHETGAVYLDNDDTTDLSDTIGAESGPIELGNGDNVMQVRRYIPDEDSVGDCNLTLKSLIYPTQGQSGTPTEDEQALTVGSLTDARLTGRQVRMVLSQAESNWRFGTPRLEVVPRGRR